MIGMTFYEQVMGNPILCIEWCPKRWNEIELLRNLSEMKNDKARKKESYGKHQIASEVNLCLFYATRSSGKGLQAAKLFWGLMNLPPPPTSVNCAYERMLAKEKKLFLMEAVWSRCFPLYDELRKQLNDNVIGEVLYVRADFGVPISEVPRVKKAELGGGTLFDLGVYTLQLAVLVFGDNPSVVACGNLNSEGVDESIDYILKYPNGKTANLCTHSKITMDNCATIYGTKGFIKIKAPFWCPTSLVLPDGEKDFPFPFKCEKMNFGNSEGLMYEAIEVRKCLKEGVIECPKMSHNDSLTIAKLQAEVTKLIGAKVVH